MNVPCKLPKSAVMSYSAHIKMLRSASGFRMYLKTLSMTSFRLRSSSNFGELILEITTDILARRRTASSHKQCCSAVICIEAPNDASNGAIILRHLQANSAKVSALVSRVLPVTLC